MYCTTCGNENSDDARFCTACGHPQQANAAPQDVPVVESGSQVPPFTSEGHAEQQFAPPSSPLPQESIPNYLPQAIGVTICCCLPAGIVAIVYAAQVNGKVSSGDLAGAREASNNARTWAWVSFGLGILSGVIYAGINLTGL